MKNVYFLNGNFYLINERGEAVRINMPMGGGGGRGKMGPAGPAGPAGGNQTLAQTLTLGRNADLVGTINDNAGNVAIDLNMKQLYSTSGIVTIDYDTTLLRDISGVDAVIWGSRQLLGAWVVNGFDIFRGINLSAILDFPNTLPQGFSDLIVPGFGVSDGDIVVVAPPSALNVGNTYFQGIATAGNVTVRFNNNSALAVDPPSATFKIKVFKQ